MLAMGVNEIKMEVKRGDKIIRLLEVCIDINVDPPNIFVYIHVRQLAFLVKEVIAEGRYR